MDTHSGKHERLAGVTDTHQQNALPLVAAATPQDKVHWKDKRAANTVSSLSEQTNEATE